MPARLTFFTKIIRFLARISFRLLIINVLLVFLPVAGFLYLDIYEKQLLISQENAMVQQGRIMSAALSAQPLTTTRAQQILLQLERRSEARLRVLDHQGYLLADSSVVFTVHKSDSTADSVNAATDTLISNEAAPEAAGSSRVPGEEEGLPEVPSWFYDLVTLPVRLYREYLQPPRPTPREAEGGTVFPRSQPYRGPEIQAALEGRYGATTRLSSGQQRSVTLYSAIPIRQDQTVIGVVLVSQSTYRILQDLYEIRLVIFRIFLASVVAAIVISFILSGTIARPLHRLRNEAEALLDRRGRLTGHFMHTRRPDEIGDLARSLLQLTTRLEKHLSFIESFAADLSHELKNPLAAMRSATDIALETDDKEEQRHFLKMVQKDIARMERLLTEAREISRIDTETLEGAPEKINLGELLEHIVTGFRIRHKEIRFDIQTPGKGVFVYGSSERLAQVFENLLDNAAGFAQQGQIELELCSQGELAVITVHDSGPGIPAENLESVFNRFFSYRPGQNAKSHHSGLGLSVAKAIVENYSGRIFAANHPGGGAVFTLTFPLAL